MKIKDIPEMVRTIQAGVEKYYGMKAVTESVPVKNNLYPEQASLEKKLGTNLFQATYVLASPAGKLLHKLWFSWSNFVVRGKKCPFTVPHGNDSFLDHYSGLKDGSHFTEKVTVESVVEELNVRSSGCDMDLLTYLDSFVRRKFRAVSFLERSPWK